MNAHEAKSAAQGAAQGGKYDAAQVYATLYLAEAVVKLTKLIESRYKPVTRRSGTSAEYASYPQGSE